MPQTIVPQLSALPVLATANSDVPELNGSVTNFSALVDIEGPHESILDEERPAPSEAQGASVPDVETDGVELELAQETEEQFSVLEVMRDDGATTVVPMRATANEAIFAVTLQPRTIAFPQHPVAEHELASNKQLDQAQPLGIVPNAMKSHAQQNVGHIPFEKQLSVPAVIQFDEQRQPEPPSSESRKALPAMTQTPSPVTVSQQVANIAAPVAMQSSQIQLQLARSSKTDESDVRIAAPTDRQKLGVTGRPTILADQQVKQVSSPLTAISNPLTFENSVKTNFVDAMETDVKGELLTSPVSSRIAFDPSVPLPTPSAPAQSPQLAKAIASQMVVAVTQTGAGTTEIMLSPEELGKVRMVVTAQDTVISVVIQAERPETGDALRRNIETLAQEFRNMGYGSINFAFEGGQSGGHGTSESSSDDDVSAVTVSDEETPNSHKNTVQDSGLDLRL